MRSKNKVIEKLSAGDVSIGLEVMLGSPRIVEMAGWAGFDFVTFDQEHCPFGFETIELLVRAADAVNLTTMVRVAQNNSKDISRVLEAGAHCVIVPQVVDAADVKKALDSVHYSPIGNRGMCPITRACRYDDTVWEEYTNWVKNEVMLIPLIENASALENIEEICSLPGVSVIGFGAGDIGQSLGVGARGLAEPVVQKALERVVKVAAKHDVVLWGMPVIDGSSPSDAVEKVKKMGVKVVQYDADALMFSRECRRIIKDIQRK